jgi:hypothetical protein
VVPADLLNYFTVTAQVAGTLIGLLFVSISLRYEAILGSTAHFTNRALAAAAFTGLVNALTISVWALVPGAGLGYPLIASGLVCLGRTLQLHLGRLGRADASWGTFLLSVAVYLGQLVEGSLLIARPGDREIVLIVAYTLFGAVATSLRRAWALVQPHGSQAAKAISSTSPPARPPGPVSPPG